MSAADCVVAYLGLGSNVGDRLGILRCAASSLRARGLEIRRVSDVYETRYRGPGGPQPDYLNAVVQVETTFVPLYLLREIQEVERALGRRPNTHMQPRTLDVDILFYGGWVIRHSELIVPHPRVTERRFVLEPLATLVDLDTLPLPGLKARLQGLRATQRVARAESLAVNGDLLETPAC